MSDDYESVAAALADLTGRDKEVFEADDHPLPDLEELTDVPIEEADAE